MQLPKLDRILAAEAALQPLLAKARDIRALSELVERFLSADLANQARVVNFRDGELALLAINSAAAAKLRLLAPSLCRYLSNQRWQVSSVSVRVQPNASHKAVAASQKTAQFSTGTVDSLKRLHDQISPSPARDALRRLLQQRGAIPREIVPPPQTAAGSKRARKPRT